MPGKRKFAQISNEDKNSDDLSSTSEKNAFEKNKNKGVKKWSKGYLWEKQTKKYLYS